MQDNRNTTAGFVPARKTKTLTTGQTVADATNGDGPDAPHDRPALETQNNDLDFPTAARLDKDFSKLRTAFERHGHHLHRSHPTDGPVTFWAERWGLVRFLPTIDAARRFLEQIGGRL